MSGVFVLLVTRGEVGAVYRVGSRDPAGTSVEIDNVDPDDVGSPVCGSRLISRSGRRVTAAWPTMSGWRIGRGHGTEPGGKRGQQNVRGYAFLDCGDGGPAALTELGDLAP